MDVRCMKRTVEVQFAVLNSGVLTVVVLTGVGLGRVNLPNASYGRTG
jgi:hypothetical protein